MRCTLEERLALIPLELGENFGVMDKAGFAWRYRSDIRISLTS